MTEAPDELGEATLHLAGTRPAMVPVVQVPYTSLLLLIGITAELATQNWRLALLAIPLWPIALWVFRQDHNGLRVLTSWIKTSGMDLRASWFGASSIEAFPITNSGRFRGIPSG